MNAPDLTIVIVNWNGEKFLPNCLRSVAAFPPSVAYEVVVIDNCSSDRSVEWLNSAEAADLFPDRNFKVIESSKNLGFGPANNLVIDQTHSQFVFLLNPDTAVTPCAIDKLLAAVSSSEEVGMSAPKLLNEDGSLQPSVWIHPPGPTSILIEGLHIYRLLPYSIRSKLLLGKHWRHDERCLVPAVSGAAMMIKRKLVNDIGAFAPDIHMYGEDAELCDRMRKHGWKIIFEPEAEIVHLGGQSSLQRWGASETRIKETEAMLAFQEKCLRPLLFSINTLTSSFVLSLYLLKAILGGRDASMLVRLLKLQMKGFWRSLAVITGTKNSRSSTTN